MNRRLGGLVARKHRRRASDRVGKHRVSEIDPRPLFRFRCFMAAILPGGLRSCREEYSEG
jgi:hypothetical protein